MDSRAMKYLTALLLLAFVSGCVRLPPKTKQPEVRKVILVDINLQSHLKVS